MPFLEFYSDKAPGKRFRIGRDDDTGEVVYVYVRAVPANAIEDIERRHRKRKTVRGQQGRQVIWEIPQTKRLLVAFEQAAYAWTNCENLTVELKDKDAAAMFSKELGTDIEIGQVITLDDKLTTKLKLEIFNVNTKLYEKIAELSNSIEEENIDEEAEETANLSNGSNGE